MRNLTRFISLTVLLGVLAGCQQFGLIRVPPDKPADLGRLLEDNEYARARQLTILYPAIDTASVQATIASLESSYENRIFAQAVEKRADGDLLGAVNVLSDALLKIPHSTLLRELRSDIEEQRQALLMRNERERLLTRGNYLLEQRSLYHQHSNLEVPGIIERHISIRRQGEADEVAAKLLAAARDSMISGDLRAARSCLQVALELQDSEQGRALHSELVSLEKVAERTNFKQASIRKAKIEQRKTAEDNQQTEKLLAETRQALEENKLHDAKSAFTRIPESSSDNEEVAALQDNLKKAVDTRVRELIMKGDALYRADRILEALDMWTQALVLDPENTEIQERTERAGRVLARLEELKRMQER